MFLLSIVLIFMPLAAARPRLPGINFLAMKCDADFAELFCPRCIFDWVIIVAVSFPRHGGFVSLQNCSHRRLYGFTSLKCFCLVLLAPAQLFCLAMPECCLPITVQSLSLKPFCFVLCTHTTIHLFFSTIKKFGISFLPLDKRLTFSHLLIRSDAEAEGTPKEKEGNP